jgi:hypothetical protein
VRTTGSAKRAEDLAPWLVGLLLAAPVLISYYPPMTDLPLHEAAVSILRNFHDAKMFPPGLYRLNLGQPNQLFHMVAWALAYPFGSRWAVKLVVAAAVIAIPVCAARFARHVGASPLAALVVAPMALGWLFGWGLVANMLGVAALLALLPTLDGFEEEPTLRGGFKVHGALLLLYFAHEAMMFVFAGGVLLFAALYPLSWKKTPARFTPFAVGVVITYLQNQWQKPLMSPVVSGMRVAWHSVLHKIKRIPDIILPATDEVVQLSMVALCVMAIGSFLWLRARERRAETPETRALDGPRLERMQTWARRYRWELFASAWFFAYFVFPLTLNGATLVYQRWFPPAFATFVVVAAPRDLWTRAARITRLIVFVLPIATLLATWPSFADSGRSYRTLEELLPLIEQGSAVAELDLGPGDPTRTFSLGPSGGRVLATRGGRLDFAFTDSPVSPVIIPKAIRWNESLIRIGFDGWAFRPEHDLRSFRYALVRTPDANVAALAQLTLAPEARYVASAGEWVLFESTLPVVPVTSRAVLTPEPRPETLRERAARIVDRMGGVPTVTVPPERQPDLSAPDGPHF